MERKNKLFREWGTQDVIAWAEEQNLGDYIKIFKAEKVTGTKLMAADKNYLEDVLGITSFRVQKRLKVMIDELIANSEHPDNFVVHGWGRNDKSQLLTNPSSHVTNPLKIKLPPDYEIYACQGDYTFLRNVKTGEIDINQVIEGKYIQEKIKASKIWSIGAGKDNNIIYCASLEKVRIPQALS